MHLLAAARTTALLRRWEISIMIMETRQRNHHIISCDTLAELPTLPAVAASMLRERGSPARASATPKPARASSRGFESARQS